jgi:hypothetical protein
MWEALTAIGSIASAVVIAVTVVMAARQVRITTDQLEQTRRAAQFEAARSVLLELAEPKLVAAYRFIIHELPERLKDGRFYHEIGQVGLADDSVHKEIYVLRALDRIGAYVRYGLVDGEIIYTSYWTRIVSSWELLADVVAIHRKITQPSFWENVEYLYDDCMRWGRAHGRTLDTSAALYRMADFGVARP